MKVKRDNFVVFKNKSFIKIVEKNNQIWWKNTLKCTIIEIRKKVLSLIKKMMVRILWKRSRTFNICNFIRSINKTWRKNYTKLS